MGCQQSLADALQPAFLPALFSPCENRLVEDKTLNNFDTRSRYSYRRIEDDFHVDEDSVLGAGVNGAVVRATSQLSGKACALKVLRKTGATAKRLDNMRSEVNTYLSIDHPNIARLLHVYEDEHRVCLVMELCEGKELFERLQQKKQFSERDAKKTTYQMLKAIASLHKQGIAHCDIKLENFLFESMEEDSRLKLIDFGFSSRQKLIYATQGTLTYAAPEVLNGKGYTKKCDLWSIGIVLYMLLTGSSPFSQKDELLARQNIMAGNISFRQETWRNISAEAVDLLKRLLTVKAEDRISAEDGLKHPWFVGDDDYADRVSTCKAPAAVSDSEGKSLVVELRHYSKSSCLQRAASAMMAHHLPSDEINRQTSETFSALAAENTGTISRGAFRQALANVTLKNSQLCLTAADADALFDSIDVARDGEIHFSEFVAATLLSRVGLTQDRVWECFEMFDVSRNGLITAGDLARVFGSWTYEDVKVKKIIEESWASLLQRVAASV